MPLVPIPTRAGRATGRALRAGFAVLSALFLSTCTDNPVEPRRLGLATVRIAPAFDAYARLAPLTLDNIRIIVVRPPADTLARVTSAFDPNSSQIQVPVTVLLQSTSEDLEITLELYAGSTLLFSGTQTVTVTSGVNTTPNSIPVVYQGPGSQIATLTIGPRDTTVRFGGGFTFGASGLDAQQAPVPDFYVSWSATAGTINAAGSFTAPLARDTVVIHAVTPNGVEDSTRVFVVAPPAGLVIAGGDQQLAPAGARLPQPFAVLVNGTDLLPVAGVPVTFAPTTGGGSVDSATATTDANGVARTGATLGAALGPQTFTASIPGVLPAVFIATAVGPGIAWTGAVSTDWNTAGNWTPALVPGLGDDVTIPAGAARQPVVSTTANVNDLTIAAGASVTLSGSFTFNIAGDLDATGGIVVATGLPTVQLSGTAATLRGSLPGATVTGSLTLSGPTTVSGDVTVSGGTALLDIGAGTLQLGGNFSTGSGGRLSMTNAAGVFTIAGSATFAGGAETGLLTAGIMNVGGNFNQSGTGSSASFDAGGTHRVILTGAAAVHTANFGTPGSGATGSHFQDLVVSGTGTVSLATEMFVDGLLISTPVTGTPTINTTGATHRLTAGGANVTGLVINQATLAIGAGTVTAFNNVQFTNSPTNLAQLTVNHPGTLTPFVFTGLSFATTPVAPNGFYLDATDSDGSAPVLTITMLGATPAIGAPFVRTSGGAVVNWSAAGGRTWTGLAGTNWSDPANWNPQVVPTNADDVVILPATNQPTVTSVCSAKSLTVNTSATLNLGAFSCQVLGSVLVDGAIIGTGVVQIQAAGQVRGTLPSLAVSAPVTLNQATGINGDLTVTGAGASLGLNGFSASVAGNFATQGGALLVMTNATDALNIGGDASFDGGNELGQMSAGVLTIGGNFTQAAATSGDSYHPSGTHLTILTATSPTVTFATPGDVPGTSHFQELAWLGGGTFTLGNDVYAHGAFTTSAVSAGTYTGAGRLLSVGSYVANGPTTFDNTRLAINAPTGGPLVFTGVTFQNMATTVAQFTVNHNGGGGPFTFTSLSFLTTPTTGFYLVANDVDGVTNGTLTINMIAPTPLNPGAFVSTTNATVNWPAAAGIVWNGSVSSDWTNPANWTPNLVPTAADNVTIPGGTPNSPQLGADQDVGSITVQATATLDANGFGLLSQGNVFADGPITNGAVEILGTGQVRGLLPQFFVRGGQATAVGALFVTGNLTITDPGANFNAGGQATSITGNLTTTVQGTLTMTNPGDVIVVLGNVLFDGASETGLLTNGVLQVQGSFTQLGTTTSFAAGGSHTTQLVWSGVGPTPMVSFADPVNSRFQNLDVTSAATLQIASNVTVLGQFSSVPASVTDTLRGTLPGLTLTVGTTVVTGLVLDNLPLVISGPGPVGLFSGVRFLNQNPAGTQLRVNSNGAATPFAFDNLQFLTTPTTGGFYISANDLDGPTPDALTINVTNSSPTSGAPFVEALNGAVVNWPVAAPGVTWTGGGGNTNWYDGLNWSSGAVPTSTDSVVIVASTTVPVLEASAAVGAVNITSGSLTIGGQILLVARTLATTGTGVLVMTDPGNADVVNVGGDAIFDGGSTNTLLTGGQLTIGGNFTQLASTSTQSFAASCNHFTELTAGAPTISFATPGAAQSHFGTLSQGQFGGTFQLAGAVSVECDLTGGDGFAGVIKGPGTASLTLRSFGSSGIDLDGVQLVVNDPTGATSGSANNVTFVNQPTTATQLTIRHPGSPSFPFDVSGVTFQVLTTGATGFYIDAADTDGPSPIGLIVTVGTPDPGNGPSFTKTDAVTQVVWPGAGVVWTGFSDNNWNNLVNWHTFTVPSATDSVIIPNTTNQPTLTGAVTLVGAVNVVGGALNLGGLRLDVARSFATTGTGAVIMQGFGDTLTVGGDALFAGGSTSGLLTNGWLRVSGNFTQTNAGGSATSFAPSGLHKTTLGSGAALTVSFGTPGSGAGGSHFQSLEVTPATGGLAFSGNTFVDSVLVAAVGAGAPKVSGTGNSLTARQWSIQSLTVDNLQMVLNEGTTALPHTFNGVLFQGFPTATTSAILIDVSAAGLVSGGRFIDFNGTQLQTTLGPGGLYVRAASSNAIGYTLRMIGSNDPTGGFTRSQAIAPAVIQYQ
jgi:hypothetical protein